MKGLIVMLCLVLGLWIGSGIAVAWHAYVARESQSQAFCTLDTVLVRILEPGAAHKVVRQDIAAIENISPCVINLRGKP